MTARRATRAARAHARFTTRVGIGRVEVSQEADLGEVREVRTAFLDHGEAAAHRERLACHVAGFVAGE